MWFPTPIYERIPLFYFLVGLLLIADGFYLGFEYAAMPYYIGFGLASCAYGTAIRVMRFRYRRNRPTEEAAAPAVDAAAAVAESAVPADEIVADSSHEHSAKH